MGGVAQPLLCVHLCVPLELKLIFSDVRGACDGSTRRSAHQAHVMHVQHVQHVQQCPPRIKTIEANRCRPPQCAHTRGRIIHLMQIKHAKVARELEAALLSERALTERVEALEQEVRAASSLEPR